VAGESRVRVPRPVHVDEDFKLLSANTLSKGPTKGPFQMRRSHLANVPRPAGRGRGGRSQSPRRGDSESDRRRQCPRRAAHSVRAARHPPAGRQRQAALSVHEGQAQNGRGLWGKVARPLAPAGSITLAFENPRRCQPRGTRERRDEFGDAEPEAGKSLRIREGDACSGPLGIFSHSAQCESTETVGFGPLSAQENGGSAS
jgi:hypothetical protein